MAELMEPFERELRRSRRQPQSAQMQQWFEDDMALALDQLAARTGNARTLGALQPGDEAKGIIAREAPRPGAATIGEMIANPVREPENPEAVRRELIDPLVSAYGMDGRGSLPLQRPVQPRTFEMGNELVQVDPATGRAMPIYTQKKTEPEMTPRQRLEYQDLLRQRQTIMGKQFATADDKARLADLDTRIQSFFAPAATAAVPPVPEASPRAFIGDPLAQPAPAATETPAAPPVSKRVKNSTYSTPKGILKWTGTGWVKP